jgi:formyltetrahydrofolate deformylase
LSEIILKVNCPDRAGLIYEISKIIYKHKLNIQKNSEFVNGEYQWFFFRAILKGEVEDSLLESDLKDILPKGSEVEIIQRKTKDIVILVTKESHCLGDLLIRYASGELNANIKAIISNHEDLKDLSLKFNLPYHCVSAEGLSRQDHEKKIIDIINSYDPQLIVLAKYMRILTPYFVQSFEGKIINIHHSFLPAFIGANPYKQAYNRGVKIIGATAHYVNNDLDEGPIIAQDVVSVNHDYSWKDMQKAGRNVEKIVLAKAVDLALDDRIFVFKNKTVIF